MLPRCIEMSFRGINFGVQCISLCYREYQNGYLKKYSELSFNFNNTYLGVLFLCKGLILLIYCESRLFDILENQNNSIKYQTKSLYVSRLTNISH
jgi:hypothetical protein